MNLIISTFLLLAFFKIVAVQTEVIPEVMKCPEEKMLNTKCTCHQPSFYMDCHDLDDEWVKKFELKSQYHVDTLVIRKSPKFPLLFEKSLSESTAGFTAKTVIFLLDSELETASGNFNALVQIAQEALEITYKGINKKLSIDGSFFNKKLQAVSLTNVEVTNFNKLNQKELRELRSIKLDKVSFGEQVKSVKFDLPKLTRIEINNCDSLVGPFKYLPYDCTTEKQIDLILKNNQKMTDFDFSEMFPADSKCKYYLDLSGSKAFKPDFLIKYAKKYITNLKIAPEMLYIILRDVPLNCDHCVYKWYSATRQQYVHSVQCQNKLSQPDKKPIYLSEIQPINFTPAEAKECA